MLETADPLEASTEAAVPDHAGDPSPDVDSPSSPTSRTTRLTRLVIGCLVGEVAVVAIALAFLFTARTPSSPVADSAPAWSVPTATADATDGFLTAWARSLEQDHRATGTLTRTALDRATLFTSAWPDPSIDAGGPTATIWVYRHARLDGRVLTQIGDLATVTDPMTGRRTCVRQTEGFACTVEGDQADAAMTAVEQAVHRATATHRIIILDPADVLADFPTLPDDIRCWEALSLTDGVDQRWGRRAQFCFHEPTGAAVFRRVLGTTRVEVLTVDSVSATVRPADLDPA